MTQILGSPGLASGIVVRDDAGGSLPMPCPLRLLALALLLPGCGLLAAEAKAPDAAAVEAARAAQAAEWQALEEAVVLAQQQGWEAFEDFFRSLADPPLRLEVLRQDLMANQWPAEEVRRRYRLRHEAAGDPRSTYLYSRVAAGTALRLTLLDQVIRRDPDLLQARVDRIRLQEHRVGDDAPLKELLEILNEDPGLAEGWRLLAQIGADYGRPDLALRAAQREPWSRFQDPEQVTLQQAAAYLAAGLPQAALDHLDRRGASGRGPDLQRVAALADLGRPVEAWALLERLAEQFPEDPQVVFNRGLVARDHLHWPEVAEAEWERFLTLPVTDQPQAAWRRLQVESWLRALHAGAEDQG